MPDTPTNTRRWHFHAKAIESNRDECDWSALLEWLENPNRKASELAFTAGPTRQVADALSGPLGCAAKDSYERRDRDIADLKQQANELQRQIELHDPREVVRLRERLRLADRLLDAIDCEFPRHAIKERWDEYTAACGGTRIEADPARPDQPAITTGPTAQLCR